MLEGLPQESMSVTEKNLTHHEFLRGAFNFSLHVNYFPAY